MSSKKLDHLYKFYGGNEDDDSEDGDKDARSKKKHHKKKKMRREKSVTIKDEEMGIPPIDRFENDKRENSGGRNGGEGDSTDNMDDGPVVVKTEELGVSSYIAEPERSSSGDFNQRRKRFDSDEEDDSDGDVKGRSNENDSDKEALRKRQRFGSSNEDNHHSRALSKRGTLNDNKQVKTRHDSSSDDEGDKKREPMVTSSRSVRYDSSSDYDGEEGRTSAGRRAGLQSASDFGKHEARIQSERRAESAAMVNQYGMGETVHRAKHGLHQSHEKRRRVLNKEEQYKLNTGVVQQRQREQARADFAQVQQSTFARGKDDADIDNIMRSVIREGDPMLTADHRKKEQISSQRGQLQRCRPVYKGPGASPNRFGILPGFRWDGNDRGNGFENRLLAQRASVAEQKEQAFRYSTGGM